ncbi:MAG: 30S ribosomal protein S6 [Flavobacteriaceae bacterium]|nr:30S ribosomal protein S6 [Flavobacteriaceae bacterium]
MKQYESVIIFTPVLSDEQLKESIARYRQMMTADGGEIVHEASWGMTKLAYPIQKKTTGFYFLFEYKANPEFIAKLELAFKRDERMLRFLTTSLDKHAIAYNLRKRNGEMNSQKAKKDQPNSEPVNA